MHTASVNFQHCVAISDWRGLHNRPSLKNCLGQWTLELNAFQLDATANDHLAGGEENVDQTRSDQCEREQPKNTTRWDVLREEINNSEETRGPEFSDRNHGLVREER